MSVTHLEDFVQMMVKSGSAGLTEAAGKAVDGPNWRETLQRLVARCYRSKDKQQSLPLPLPQRTRSRGGDEDTADKLSFANAIQLANSAVSEYSPVVSLYDVLKFKPNDEVAVSNKPLLQDEFLNYFGLSLNNNLTTSNTVNKMLAEKPEPKLYSTHHPRNLINTPQVPFSSDLGIKLIKERPEIPREIHERKLERLERFLQTIPSSDNVEYEVIYNKNVDLESSHFYTFPTRNFHDKNKLTPKARHLLKKYCKPCSVQLLRLDTKTLKRFVSRQSVEKSEENSESKDQKENIQLLKNKSICLDGRVVLADNSRKPNHNPSFKSLRVKGANFLTNKPIPKTSDNESRRSPHRNFLKTLIPRDENTIDIKKDAGSAKNLINACVVLQPINNLIGLRSRKCLKNSNGGHQKVANGRIEKIKVDKYSPRRVSPRLKIVNNALM